MVKGIKMFFTGTMLSVYFLISSVIALFFPDGVAEWNRDVLRKVIASDSKNKLGLKT